LGLAFPKPPNEEWKTQKSDCASDSQGLLDQADIGDVRRRVSEGFTMDKAMKKVQPAAKKRGADPNVPHESGGRRVENAKDRKLEQGLEESMAGSDPPSITQPASDKPPESSPGAVPKKNNS
jgi:hypothetical protein